MDRSEVDVLDPPVSLPPSTARHKRYPADWEQLREVLRRFGVEIAKAHPPEPGAVLVPDGSGGFVSGYAETRNVA